MNTVTAVRDRILQLCAERGISINRLASLSADVYKRQEDSSFGTIDANGLFRSNGKCGTVTAQLLQGKTVLGTTSAVSYTHLDVYKRQVEDRHDRQRRDLSLL